MNDFEVMFFPCNCGHTRPEHVHGDQYSIDGNKTYLGYCKKQWTRECPCDQYEQMTKLEYMEWRYDTTRSPIH